ncbi:MAG: FAD-dependent oxidoreductase, partial [Pseudomonadota bacterium]
FRSIGDGSGHASAIQHIHCFNHAAMMSLGNLANDIPAVSEGAERLANAIASSFFVEDSGGHRAGLDAYSDPELLGDEIPQLEGW